MSTALMIVDVQQGMFALPQQPHDGEAVVRRIAGLLARARDASVPVVHVQHDGGPGHVLAKGSAGWPHHPLVAPRPGEIVVEKRQSSAFHDTDLDRQLRSAGIDRLIVAGMQTEMCVDSACRGAVANGLSAMGFSLLVGPALAAKRCMCWADERIQGKPIALHRVVLVSDGHTTYDTPVIPADRIIAHHNRLLGRAFAELAEAGQVQF